MSRLEWTILKDEAGLGIIKGNSQEKPHAIFKHSTRCSLSSMIRHRLERSVVPAGVAFYFLDLVSNRVLSNRIEREFGVVHESPQILLIKNGQCVFHSSHNAICMEDIVACAQQ